MNIIRMTGGLGNQMFQYALYLKLRSMGKEVKFDDITEYGLANARPIMLWAFGITYPRADKAEINEITDGSRKLAHRIRRKLFGRRSREYHEKDCNFDPQVLLQEDAYLTGYFQSEKYFKDIEQQVRQAFAFSDGIWQRAGAGRKEKTEGYLLQIKNCESVSLHIRRGDYLEMASVYGGICTEEYYQKAVTLMEEELPGAKFFIFSNEPAWAKQWASRIYGEDGRFTVIEGTTEDKGYLDMLLMSRCRHHIIANSSFSWWGAWLNGSPGKKVIAPALWLRGQDYIDIFTEGMIRVNGEGRLAG
ncbi:O-antigen biosynthesis glycosyltransferase WbnK [Lachnospiraceae bacterium]|nr:O-antigen biosynthesis glycosyltransferase WbnK [Lachnospiraceae bacterium]